MNERIDGPSMNGILSVVEIERDVAELVSGFYIQLEFADDPDESLMLIGPFDTAHEAIELATVCVDDPAALETLFAKANHTLH